MGRVIKLTESDLRRIVKRVINEQMLYENIEVIDKILDKVGESGIESLSKSEKDILDKYSEWIKGGNSPADFKLDDEFDEGDMDELVIRLLAANKHTMMPIFEHTKTFSDGSVMTFYTSNKHINRFETDHPNKYAYTLGGEISYEDKNYEGDIMFELKGLGVVTNVSDHFDEKHPNSEMKNDGRDFILLGKMWNKGLNHEFDNFLKECCKLYLKKFRMRMDDLES